MASTKGKNVSGAAAKPSKAKPSKVTSKTASKKAPAKKGAAKKPAHKAPAAGPACVLAGGAHRFEVKRGLLSRLAMEWSYVVRSRHRWAESEAEVERLSSQARADLGRLGVGAEELEKLARCRIVEVQLDYANE
ncbi:MAG TPA: hypothetical protein VLC09_07190, partial [Polyangiaceae bacterium]|nr:hypothetical protein [Polyangiaceae bacterium]